MNSFSYLVPLSFIIVIFALTIIFIVVGKITFLNEFKTSFTFRNHFPFELYYQRNIKNVTYFRLILIALLGVLLASAVIFVISFKGNNNNLYFALAIAIFYIIAYIVSFILFMIGPILLSQFKIYVTILFASSLMSNVASAILCFNSIYDGFVHKIIGGFIIVLALFNLLSMLNPKLKEWSKLDSIKNPDGTISHVRPKISYLALSIWLTYLSLIIGSILYLLSITLSLLNI